MRTKSLLIVESPTKVKTIKQYLSNNYEILSCVGHVKDLPKNNLGIDIEDDFKIELSVLPEKKKFISELRKKAKASRNVYIATDPDREGEAIAWHVREILESKKLLKGKKVERVVFNEITKKAVTNGINNPREIESLLVNAYMARRALDYLVGFNISPILHVKFPPML